MLASGFLQTADGYWCARLGHTSPARRSAGVGAASGVGGSVGGLLGGG